MVGCGKGRGLEAADRVAALALAAIGAFGKLTAVRVLLVAVGTLIVRDRRLEVAALVAGQAGDIQVLTCQWVGSF